MKPLEWTRPCHGVSHLEGLPNGYQITVDDGEKPATVYLLALCSPNPTTPIREEIGTLEFCKTIGAEWAVSLRDQGGEEP